MKACAHNVALKGNSVTKLIGFETTRRLFVTEIIIHCLIDLSIAECIILIIIIIVDLHEKCESM